LVILALVAASGCSKQGTLYPVSGRVSINGEPLAIGTVGLIPDVARGNTSPYAPQGKLGPDGVYTIATLDRPGAAPGWYRVAVWAMANEPASESYQAMKDFQPQWLVNEKYTQAANTPLAIEVVAVPTDGAYDLKLSHSAPPVQGTCLRPACPCSCAPGGYPAALAE
jgi:hypothetical protein